MPEITITETQRERLEQIRTELEAAFIDTYGEIRTTDGIQYLLDTYTPPEQQTSDAALERIATAEFPLLQRVAADVEGVPGSGIDTETMRGELLSSLGVEEFAARLSDLDVPEDSDTDPDGTDTQSDAADGTEMPADSDSVSNDEPSAAPADDSSAAVEDEDTDSQEAADANEDGGGAADGDTVGNAESTSDGPGSVLSAANQLLDTHDGKWREGDTEPYEVDLPDGTTEKVRTKDDIRGLLFKHY